MPTSAGCIGWLRNKGGIRAEPSYSVASTSESSIPEACLCDRQDYYSLRKQAPHPIHIRTYLRDWGRQGARHAAQAWGVCTGLRSLGQCTAHSLNHYGQSEGVGCPLSAKVSRLQGLGLEGCYTLSPAWVYLGIPGYTWVAPPWKLSLNFCAWGQGGCRPGANTLTEPRLQGLSGQTTASQTKAKTGQSRIATATPLASFG